jgi:hypothetical protein
MTKIQQARKQALTELKNPRYRDDSKVTRALSDVSEQIFLAGFDAAVKALSEWVRCARADVKLASWRGQMHVLFDLAVNGGWTMAVYVVAHVYWGHQPTRSGDRMTREEHALRLQDLALSVVRSKGVTRLDGSTSILEYHYGLLTIHYRSAVGALDVWCVHKVLVVDRFAGKPQLIRYVPGAWERVLMQAAMVAAWFHPRGRNEPWKSTNLLCSSWRLGALGTQ